MATVFDKLAFVWRLEGASILRHQAEATSEAFHDAVSESVATKADILRRHGDIAGLKSGFAGLRTAINAELSDFRAEFRGDIAAFKAEVKTDLRDISSSLKLWVVSVGFGAAVTTIGAMTAILRVLLKSPS